MMSFVEVPPSWQRQGSKTKTSSTPLQGGTNKGSICVQAEPSAPLNVDEFNVLASADMPPTYDEVMSQQYQH